MFFSEYILSQDFMGIVKEEKNCFGLGMDEEYKRRLFICIGLKLI